MIYIIYLYLEMCISINRGICISPRGTCTYPRGNYMSLPRGYNISLLRGNFTYMSTKRYIYLPLNKVFLMKY